MVPLPCHPPQGRERNEERGGKEGKKEGKGGVLGKKKEMGVQEETKLLSLLPGRKKIFEPSPYL